MIGSIIEGPPENLANDIMNANKDLFDDDMDVTNEKSIFSDLMFGKDTPEDLENDANIGGIEDEMPLSKEESTNELRDMLG